jgi:maltooligosyltrehalose trehalohydrolase
VLYELHVGAFTPEVTFRAAIEKLDHLCALGITAIELMTLSDFAGTRNWGYDMVLLYAPDSAYGRPDDLKAFVDAAHARGLMVIFDVVYNHFGPEGNYLPLYFPQILSKDHNTAWGPALNFDGECSREARELILGNAMYWLEEFHADGLRLDAAHAIIDNGPKHILDELAERVHAWAQGRHVHLILENEGNIAQRLERTSDGCATCYTAQWNHDIDHLLGAAFQGGKEERLEDDRGETDRLGKCLAEGFVIAAEEKGDAFASSCHVPPTAFVGFIQSHDLIGNRVFGERIFSLLAPEPVRAIVAVYLLLPQIPMLFMGEEWGASSPFPYFCDFHGKLGEDVQKGRCEQLSKLPGVSKEDLKHAPDCQSGSTFLSSKLHWDELAEAPHAEWLRLYRDLLRVRHAKVAPLLAGLRERCGAFQIVGPGGLLVEWSLNGGKLRLAANLWHTARQGLAKADGSETLWLEGSESDAGSLAAWSVRWEFIPSGIAGQE